MTLSSSLQGTSSRSASECTAQLTCRSPNPLEACASRLASNPTDLPSSDQESIDPSQATGSWKDSSRRVKGEKRNLCYRIKDLASALFKALSMRTESVDALSSYHFGDGDWLHHWAVKERFLISSYPYESYWESVVKNRVAIGIQLVNVRASEYHLELHQKLQLQDALLQGASVELVEVERVGEITTRSYRIQEGSAHWFFQHLQIHGWYDLEAPEEESFSRLFQLYSNQVKQLNRPTVHVHCAGGKGRAGTFVLARILCACPKLIDQVEQLLFEMRQQRPGLVETAQQQAFACNFALCFSSKSDQSSFSRSSSGSVE